MSGSQPLIHCLNRACSNPLNSLDSKLCEACQTPLEYRYLWAEHPFASQIPPGELVQERYQVISPRIWLDTRPDLMPHITELLPEGIMPYLHLYPQRLHIPEVYGYAVLSEDSTPPNILLLENVPVDATGKLMPSIVEAWEQASAVRQLYWLWQILELWKPLAEEGVVSSLLLAENLRVEGWRVRLLQLYPDVVELIENSTEPGLEQLREFTGTHSLQQLGNSWASWFGEAQSQVSGQLQELYQQLLAEDGDYSALARSLNQLLLEQAALNPLRWQVGGATDSGPRQERNEDYCFPTADELPDVELEKQSNPSRPQLMIVCDGIGGHEGGEVASQLAVQTLKLQLQARLTEVAEDAEILTPDVVAEQLAAIIRVANNLITTRNDEQNREARQRMGTTLVMALQLPQQLIGTNGIGNSHELYIAHIGDSRAYWITPQYCQQLTVDDVVATREVRMGRSLYRQALQRQDAGSLTQAIGTRDALQLRPTVQRFILEEDGLLLLCSDGLSDRNLVEQSWADYAEPILKGEISLKSAVEYLIHLANQKNGHDNTSVVLGCCRVAPEYQMVHQLSEMPTTSITPQDSQSSEQTSALHVVLDAELVSMETPHPAPRSKFSWLAGLTTVMVSFTLLLVGGAFGLTAWWRLNPDSFHQFFDRFAKPEQPHDTPHQPPSSPLPRQDQP